MNENSVVSAVDHKYTALQVALKNQYLKATTPANVIIEPKVAVCMTCVDMYFYVWKMGDISMMVICYATDVIEYDRGTTELSNAPLHITQETPNIERTPLSLKPPLINLQYFL